MKILIRFYSDFNHKTFHQLSVQQINTFSNKVCDGFVKLQTWKYSNVIPERNNLQHYGPLRSINLA